MTSLEQRREQWRQRITQQERSKQPIRTFCREHGLNENMFYAWRLRLREEGQPVRFALVEGKFVAPAGSQPLEFVLTSGDRLRLPADAPALRLVLSVLREQR